MFEAVILLALLGLIIWFILARGETRPTRKASFITLVAELKPPKNKSDKNYFS